MKPTSQIDPSLSRSRRQSGDESAPESLPLTDYSYQSNIALQTGSAAILSEKKLRAFRSLSRGLFGPGVTLEYATELLFFTLITAISAWPIISAMVAVTRLVRNY